ncbi:MAG: carboxypeptidase-like regulatory domain-containing protein, partial [Chitinophagales bacterium]
MKKKLRLAFSASHPRFYLLLLFSFFLSEGLSAQTVTGTVTDTDKKPIANVTVQVKGTPRTVLTDAAGNFSITASGDNVLVFSYV